MDIIYLLQNEFSTKTLFTFPALFTNCCINIDLFAYDGPGVQNSQILLIFQKCNVSILLLLLICTKLRTDEIQMPLFKFHSSP